MFRNLHPISSPRENYLFWLLRADFSSRSQDGNCHVCAKARGSLAAGGNGAGIDTACIGTASARIRKR